MNWLIKFFKKVLLYITSNSKAPEIGSSQVPVNSTPKPAYPEVAKPVGAVTPLPVIKPATTVNQPQVVKTAPPTATPPLVKTAPTLSVEKPSIQTAPKMNPQVAENKPPAEKLPIRHAPTSPSQTRSSSTVQSAPVQYGLEKIQISGKPFKISLTGQLSETLLTVRRKVNYLPNNVFKQNVPLHFPLVLMPLNNTDIKPPVNGKSSNKGMTEESFCRDFLMKYFKSQVYDSLTLFIGSSPYEPDLAFIDLNSGKNIFIDIEIDEPYDGVTKSPTHYRTSNGTIDDDRNKGFTDRGWMVIRFAEEQIIKSPKGCIKFIGDVIKSVFPGFTSDCLSLSDSLTKIPIWSLEESTRFARENKREKYLGISQFFQSNGPRDYSIVDSQLGKEIEGNLHTKTNPVSTTARPNTTILNSPPLVSSTSPKHPTPFTLEPARPSAPPTPSVNKPIVPVPPPIVSKPLDSEPRVTTKTDKPSQPAPRPYAYE